MSARAVAVLALVLGGALLAPGATAAPTDTAPPALRGAADRPVVTQARYARDVLASAQGLLDLARIMQDADDLETFREDYPKADAALGRFRGAVARMRAYRLEAPRVDRQRAALARAGPPLARSLTRFLAAARRGEAAEVRRLLPGVQRAVARFQAAGRPIR